MNTRKRRTIGLIAVFGVVVLMAGCLTINLPPTAQFIATPGDGPVPLTVTFDASASSDDDGEIIAYNWEFGDGETGSGVVVTHTYDEPGTYAVQLHVIDDGGLTTSQTVMIEATQPMVQILEWTLDRDALGACVEGTAKNVSGGTLAAAEIVVVFEDDEGDELDRGGDTEQDIAPGEEWTFTICTVTVGTQVDSASVFVGDVRPE